MKYGMVLVLLFSLVASIACAADSFTFNQARFDSDGDGDFWTLSEPVGEVLVSGPASATVGNMPQFSSSSGKAISDSGYAVHPAVTLSSPVDAWMGISGQQLTFDVQAPNLVVAYPASGTGYPAPRALVAGDMPSTMATDAEVSAAVSDMMTLSTTQTAFGAKTFASTTVFDGGLDSMERIYVGSGLAGDVWAILEGATNDGFETELALDDPTSDAKITVPSGLTGKFAVSSTSGYDASTWNGSLYAPTQDAVRDKIEYESAMTVQLAGSQTVTGDKKLTGSTEFERVSGDGPLIDVDANNAAVLQIEGQVDAVDWFNATITTVAPGDGAVVGPRASDEGDGWLFVGMVRVRINGSYFYMPYYSPDEL